jgi:hypothetical protein
MSTLNTLTRSVSFAFLLGFAASGGITQAAEPPPGFTPLFNGKDLTGWWGATTENPSVYLVMTPEQFKQKHDASLADINKHWRAEDAELVNDGNGLYLTTDKNYRDFELLIDYKTVPKADSGIYLKGCPQVQIWDYTDAGKFKLGSDKGSGGLWNNSAGNPGKDPFVKADKAFGEWNHFRIIQVGSRTWVWLNEKLVVENAILENYFDKKRQLPIPVAGPLQLQTHGGEIRWRNVYIREIGSDEANQLLRDNDPVGLQKLKLSGSSEAYSRNLRGKDPAGFQPIFNGKDFDGWAGPVENYEIKEGAIVCKPGKGGTIYTQKTYRDFVARIEFKLPPGGNNGLAIRYPGKGDTAYVGMTELQVLDDGHPKYAALDPRQAHGSAYGMVPSYRGYLRPVGEWNYEEVTVAGSKIKVELNGTVILNCDLSTVTETMKNSPHPGKDRTEGFFGFAGHSDPVMFRNISIKPLE